MAAAHYLAGTHIGSRWVFHDWDKEKDMKSQIRDLEEQTLDVETILEKATKNLEALDFIGITENFEESVTMFNYQFPNTHKKKGRPEHHENERQYEEATEETKDKLR